MTRPRFTHPCVRTEPHGPHLSGLANTIQCPGIRPVRTCADCATIGATVARARRQLGAVMDLLPGNPEAHDEWWNKFVDASSGLDWHLRRAHPERSAAA
jgi:hypothetical protein